MKRVARYTVVALILGLAVVLTLAFRRDPHDIRTGTVGQPAPAFVLADLSGNGPIRSESYDGKIVVLNFWASWCVPCKEENPALTAVWERYRGTDVVFIGIVFQDTTAAARDYTARLGNTWLNAVDETGQVSLSYGVFGPPETYFIGADGVIAGRHIGPIDSATLVNAIEKLRRSGQR